MTRRFAEDTRVPVSQTRADIEKILARHKTAMFGTAVDYETLKARVQFKAHGRIVRFIVSLPDPKKFTSSEKREREERRIWRALLLVIKAKLESTESGIETFESAFLAQIVLPNDQTIADTIAPQIALAYKEGKMPKALMASSEDQK